MNNMSQFEMKGVAFAIALENVYRKPEEREDYLKLELEEESLTEDFTAMLWGLFAFYKNITGEDIDILDFISILTRLVFQHEQGGKEGE